ncbi:probable protein phosphatase 2C 24 [Malania oleifera]|uniref:probable protein phosphatase 2C 24 n=1 Tax=Malania oleifera TaxID=397392 RepID=UPI0025AE29BF|nr:probable protein phosphatase 2C 24 [Malania oleifera]
MAEICCGVVGKSEAGSSPCEPSSRTARRRRMDVRRFRFVDAGDGSEQKRRRLDVTPPSRVCENTTERFASDSEKESCSVSSLSSSPSTVQVGAESSYELPKFGVVSICGRRREMEDAVATHPSLCVSGQGSSTDMHYYGVYDGHGCSHVAMKCRDRLHELVKEELENSESLEEWKEAMRRSFSRMDKEATAWNELAVLGATCRCELQSPECDAVGSTAVVAIVTPEKILVANCGDSRAVLCRNGKAVPLSSDHKPDRPDELQRIQGAGGRVIYWDGARVLGVLAMSRAIGDNYLKPYVSCEPEVTIKDRTAEDECLILASDGLWDVVSNEMACGVARMCLRGKAPPPPPSTGNEASGEVSDKACSDASMLLTRLALARRSTDNISVLVIDLRRGT